MTNYKIGKPAIKPAILVVGGKILVI